MDEYRNNNGDRGELHIAAVVAGEIVKLYGATDLFLADHTHEELTEGACSIAWEGGDYNWTVAFTQTSAAEGLRMRGLLLEPINSVILGIYPVHNFSKTTDRQLNELIAEQFDGTLSHVLRQRGARLERSARNHRALHAETWPKR